MPRKSKTPKDAGLEADELIKKNADEGVKTEDPPKDNDDIPLDIAEEGDDKTADSDEFDLSSLDDGGEDDDSSGVDGDFKHKYEVLKGKYDTEISRLSQELSKINQQNQLLVNRLSTVRTAGESIGEEDLNESLKLLKEQYPVIYKGVMAVLRKEGSSLVRGTEAKVDNLARHAMASQRDRYYDSLTKAVPKWEVINKHPAFLKWLGQTDRYTGAQKGALLKSSFDRFDVSTTVTFFEDFMDEKGIKNQSARSSDENNVAPNTSGSTSPKREANAGFVKRSDIKKFYSDKASGRYTGTKEEAEKQERRFIQAIKEGKVIER